MTFVSKSLLWMLSKLYQFIMKLRNYLYDQKILSTYKSNLKVICVGNLSVGGNGKTPLVMYLVGLLKEQGRRPVVLTRGYGGSICGPHLLLPEDAAAKVGDEARLISNQTNVPVVVARDRSQGARFIESQALGNIIILDDGFQHRALQRDLDILTVNIDSERAIQEFLNGELLPLGKFRENKQQGLQRAQAIVFSARRPQLEPIIDARLTANLPVHLKIFHSCLKIEGVFSSIDGSQLAPQMIGYLCAIANPEGFIESLKFAGFEIETGFALADHYNFSKTSLENMTRERPDLNWVCTEKDLVKLTPAKNLYFLKTSLIVTPNLALLLRQQLTDIVL